MYSGDYPFIDLRINTSIISNNYTTSVIKLDQSYTDYRIIEGNSILYIQDSGGVEYIYNREHHSSTTYVYTFKLTSNKFCTQHLYITADVIPNYGYIKDIALGENARLKIESSSDEFFYDSSGSLVNGIGEIDISYVYDDTIFTGTGYETNADFFVTITFEEDENYNNAHGFVLKIMNI